MLLPPQLLRHFRIRHACLRRHIDERCCRHDAMLITLMFRLLISPLLLPIAIYAISAATIRCSYYARYAMPLCCAMLLPYAAIADAAERHCC